MQLNALLRSFICLTLGLFAVACGGASSPPDASTACNPGELGCRCYGNQSCNQPLVCSAALLCVAANNLDSSTGLGGSGGSVDAEIPDLGTPEIDAPLSTGGTGGNPGLGGVGGTPGVGGATGGGLGGVGAGGTGGTGATGGKAGTGGSVVPDAGIPPVDAGPEATLNGPCTTVGALNCVGHAQKGMMMCDGTKWVPNGACAGSQLCDTMAGPTQGTCVAPVSNCANQQPGYSYCSGNSKVTCGPDLLTVSGETCPFACSAGKCTGECVPSSRDCDGQTPLSCATNATWLRGTTCAGDCNKGICCGSTTPTLCNGTCVDPQTSNANCGGCGVQCSTAGGKSCRAGVCQCPAGMTDCSGTCVSLTTSSTNCGGCGKVCAAGRTCQTGVCACPSGTLECNGVCTNVQADNANCGACGVTCGAATCYAGTCGGDNLITNGDFSNGSTHWQITQATTGVTSGMSGSMYCVSLPSYGEAFLGWGNATSSVAIVAGYGYTWAYTVSSTDPLYSFTAKIGHTVSPYTTVYTTSLDTPSATPRTFIHNFTPTYADTSAGLVFDIYASTGGATVCFDDVSLVRH